MHVKTWVQFRLALVLRVRLVFVQLLGTSFFNRLIESSQRCSILVAFDVGLGCGLLADGKAKSNGIHLKFRIHAALIHFRLEL